MKKSKKGVNFEKTPLDVILKLANPLHVLDDDFVAAAELKYGDARNKCALFLNIVKGIVVSEALICQVLNRSVADSQIIELFMQKSGGIGVTAEMLEVVQTDRDLEQLLKHKSMCQITSGILKSQKTLRCMELLLDFDPETPVNEEVIFRALEIENHSRSAYVLEILFDRSTDIAVSQEMLQAARYAANMEILLKRLQPGTRIFIDVVAAVSKLKYGEAYKTLRTLLKFDFSIRLDPKMALQTIGRPIKHRRTGDASGA